VAEAGVPASGPAAEAGPFERDTAVTIDGQRGSETKFDAVVADGWRAGRGPHGGYMAAMLLRALTESVAEPERSPRSLTIHYARAPEPGPVRIRTVLEREGRSLSTLSARIEQEGRLVALALSAFSVPWSGLEISELPLPDVAGPDGARRPGSALKFGAPDFTRHLIMQPRVESPPFSGAGHPMEFGAWLGLAEARPLDPPALAFFSDALIPAPFMGIAGPTAAPTVDLTIHFRVALPRVPDPDPHELCFARVKAGVIHEGFFEEDGVIWATDGTVLAQSRQLAILLPASA
jgi:acyl-CoA thioesterase